MKCRYGLRLLEYRRRGERVNLQVVARIKSDIADLPNNPQQLDPPFLLFFHELTVDGKTVIAVQVPLYADGATPLFQENEHSFVTILPLAAEQVTGEVTPRFG